MNYKKTSCLINMLTVKRMLGNMWSFNLLGSITQNQETMECKKYKNSFQCLMFLDYVVQIISTEYKVLDRQKSVSMGSAGGMGD